MELFCFNNFYGHVEVAQVYHDKYEIFYHQKKEEFLEEDWLDEDFSTKHGNLDLILNQNKNMNITQLLNQREIGGTDVTRCRKANFLLLTFLTKVRWPSITYQEFINDAKILLGRDLKSEERLLLYHLFDSGVTQSSSSISWEKNQEPNSLIDPLQSFTFAQLLDIMQKSGFTFGCNDEAAEEKRKRLTTTILDLILCNNSHRTYVEVVHFFVKRGIDINAAEVLECYISCLYEASEDTFVVTKLLLQSIKRTNSILSYNPLEIFLKHVDFYPNAHAVEIVRLFIEFGFYYEKAMEDFCSNRTLHSCLYSQKSFENLFAIFFLLRETANSLLLSCSDTVKNSHFCKIYKYWCSRKTVTYVDLINHLINRRVNLNGILLLRDNLLTAVCRYYDGVDLPYLIHRLCKNGCDVNHVMSGGINALMCLAGLRARKILYSAVKELLTNGVLVNWVDCKGRNALNYLVSFMPFTCCNFKLLQILNESKFWDTLNLLLDAGISVVEPCNRGSVTILGSLFYAFDSHSICSRCATSLRLRKEDAIEEARRTAHYECMLRFVDRLLKAGAPLCAKYCEVGENLILYACAFFRGDVLVDLVRLLCEHGADVRTGAYSGNLWTVARNRIVTLLSDDCSENKRNEVFDILEHSGYLQSEILDVVPL